MAEKKKNKGGAKNKYESNVKPKFEEIKELYSQGARDKDIMNFCDIKHTAFYSYIEKHKEFSDVIKEGHRLRWKGLEESLFKKATGFEVDADETKIETIPDETGKQIKKVTVTKKKKYFAPDTTALIFSLSNRFNEDWKQRRDEQENTNVNITITRDDDV